VGLQQQRGPALSRDGDGDVSQQRRNRLDPVAIVNRIEFGLAMPVGPVPSSDRRCLSLHRRGLSSSGMVCGRARMRRLPVSRGSRFLAADVGVLGPGVATGPAALIDKATGVRPATRLERVIADMWLQLAEVIIHDGLLIPAADEPGSAC
jgi:hypothetical protein